MFPDCCNCSNQDLQKYVMYVGLTDLMVGLLRFYLYEWSTEKVCDLSLTWINLIITLNLVAQVFADLVVIIGAGRERVNCILFYLGIVPILFLASLLSDAILLVIYKECLHEYIYISIPLNIVTPLFWLIVFIYYMKLKDEVIFGISLPNDAA